MKFETKNIKKLKDVSKSTIDVLKIFSFSYFFIGVLCLLFSHIYSIAYSSDHDPTFPIWFAAFLEVPFWPWFPNVRVTGILAMIILIVAILRFKALDNKKFDIIATIFQILLLVSVVGYVGIYLGTKLLYS
jgi:hypothetical protein